MPHLPDIINVDFQEMEEKALPLRMGTPVEKNVVLGPDRLAKVEPELRKKLAVWSAYPDIWCDEVLIPTSSSFKLMFYQRVMMRSLARVPLNHITAARGVSKTFITLLMAFHRCIFAPGHICAFAAPNKSQSAQIAKQTVTDLLSRFPLLNNELDGNVIGGKDYFEVRFKNKSIIKITAALDSTRGSRFDSIDVDEARDQNGDDVNGILVPTVSKNRVTYGAGKMNPFEMHQIQTFTTSASSKSSYNYEKLLDLLIRMIINPKSASVIGFDYKVPVVEGIYPASFVQDQKMDPTMNEQLFAREYLSIYTEESDDSWFNFKKINKHRKIINAEWRAKFNNGNPETFYLISVDVGRIHDNTVVTVFKVMPNNGRFRCVVVNVIVLGRTNKTKQFSKQVLEMKKIIKAFEPREVVIDTNGLGISIPELMIQTQYDDDGTEYGPIGIINDERFTEIQPADAPKLIYSFKANQKINSEMFGNCYSRIDAGLVDFLIKEQAARSKLLATKKGQKMTLEEKTKFLMPYEMTSKLFEEMGNLRLKRTGNGLDIILEPINSRFPDDRFSSLCIGLRRIKELEDDYAKNHRKGNRSRKLFFFSGG